MKRHSCLTVLVLLFLLAANGLSQDALPAQALMRKVSDKLASIKLLGYNYRFEFSYPSQGRLIEEQAEAFLDLKPADGTSQFRFQFVSPGKVAVFNGTERFFLVKEGKKIYVESKPSFKSFGDVFLQNSPLSLKYALPRIIADGTIQKKVSLVRSGDRDQYLIEFSLPKGIINSAGEIIEIRPDHTNLYKLKVDKATLFPVEVVQSNDKNDEVLKTTYVQITEKPAMMPADPSWFFSSYLNEYALQKKDTLTLIEPGKTAAEFSLARFGSVPNISLDQYKGKLVLLEFWIAHCGFCIAAVPKLNDISRKFRDRGLEIVSINMYDPASTIEAFKKKNGPEFAIATGGDSIATAYGVDAFPALVLLDPSGKVVYSSSGLQEKELEAAIVSNLQK